MYLFVYKTTHKNGRYYIGRHQSTNLDDGYIGSGKWVKSIKDKTQLTREIIAEADSLADLKILEKRLISIHYDDPRCMNYLYGSDGWSSKDQAGKNNQTYDDTVYHFINTDGREEMCTRYELSQKYQDVNRSSLSRMVNSRNGIGAVGGWRLFGTTAPSSIKSTIYHFIHRDGRREALTQQGMLIRYPELGSGNLSKLVNNKAKSVKGWRLDITCTQSSQH